MSQQIGVGSYGCVYRPAFTCIEKPRYKRPYISKLFKQDAKRQQELETYRNLNLAHIDPEMRFFISEPEVCNLSQQESTRAKSVMRYCSSVLEPINVLNYIDAGITLTKLLTLTRPDYYHILHSLENIFQGVALLHKHGIYHLDIKEDNITYMDGVFKLIDFGISHTNLNPPQTTIGSPLYMPPEVYFIGTNVPSDSIFNMFMISVFLPTIRTLDLDFEPEAYPTMKEYKTLENEEKYNKSDIWALGIMFYRLKNHMEENLKFKKLALFLANFSRKLLILNVRDRPNATKAYQYYRTLLKKLPTCERGIKKCN